MTVIWFMAVVLLAGASVASAVAMSRTVSHQVLYSVLAVIASIGALVVAFFPPA